jgi:mannose-6-phosphate isomerase class I
MPRSPLILYQQPNSKMAERKFGQVKAIAVKKGWGETALAALREMGTLRCDGCGEDFVIGHPPQTADEKTAERQARWLEKVLAEEHELEKKHTDRIELPDEGFLDWQQKRPA